MWTRPEPDGDPLEELTAAATMKRLGIFPENEEDIPGEDENNPEEFENTVDINGWT
jgi:hypothetical protein